jgi:hypothetical protein
MSWQEIFLAALALLGGIVIVAAICVGMTVWLLGGEWPGTGGLPDEDGLGPKGGAS